MPKKMLIDATHAEETRVVVVDGNKVDEFDFEALNRRQLAGNIYLAKVTRVEPSLQAAFVDYGGNRHGFLAFSEVHPDYYQIPQADRDALLQEEADYAKAKAEVDEWEAEHRKTRKRRKPKVKAAEEGAPSVEDAVVVEEDDTGLVDVPEGQPAESTETDETTVVLDTPEQSESDEAPTADPVAEDDDTVEVSESSDDDGGDDQPYVETPEEDSDPVPKKPPQPRKPRARRYKIQEVIKVRQILLIQVVKEERGNKGAAVTTYLSLAGRYCVLMPNTARGGGISRKITNAADRKKLKTIAESIHVPQGAGLIVRTAGAQRTKTEIKRDYEYLLRQWENIKTLTFKSTAPAPIYEEGSLIKRSIRDLYSKEIDEIFVDGERGYREAKDYMKMLMPSHAKNVKQYKAALPLFSRYQVEGYLAAMFNPTVQLKSGGYIVIGITEALVAIDVNSGRATKEKSIEDTATKTNLEAADEVARQLRLRDLAGLIVIDFIDMDERRNNTAVEKRMKDRIKNDRARIQIGRISSFGLMEMSRQRLRPGMLEASTQPCPHCHGTGITRSNDSMTLAILRELEEEGVRRRAKEVLVTAPIEVANYMLNAKREHVAMIESRFGLSVRIEADASLISPEYRVERFNTATRIVPIPETLPSMEMPDMPEIEEAEEVEAPAAESAPTPETTENGTDQPKKRRRRRRSRRRPDDQTQNNGTEGEAVAGEATPEAPADKPADDKPAEDKPVADKPKRSRSRTRKRSVKSEPEAEMVAEAPAAAEIVEVPETAAPQKKPARKRVTAKAPTPEAEPVTVEEPKAAEPAVAEPAPEVVEAPEAVVPQKKPARKRVTAKAPMPEAEAATVEEPATTEEPKVEEAVVAEPAPEPEKKPRSIRRGWWAKKSD